jgi:hypothetical protein
MQELMQLLLLLARFRSHIPRGPGAIRGLELVKVSTIWWR